MDVIAVVAILIIAFVAGTVGFVLGEYVGSRERPLRRDKP
jgi:hypothetical protein